METMINREEQFMVIEGGKSYTVADIEALPPGEKAELIDGEMFVMDAPSITHQRILGELHVQIYMHIKNNKGPCEVFIAPGVYVKDDIYNYVEPDITVICNDDKLDEKGCHGAPDWVIEIASPSNKYMDYGRKLMLYQSAGIREYWIVDPTKRLSPSTISPTMTARKSVPLPSRSKWGFMKISIWISVPLFSRYLRRTLYKRHGVLLILGSSVK